jgi:hypothetical protein
MTKTYNQFLSEQEYTSKGTSRNQIAAGFKKIDWIPGTTNLDYGGGKYEKATMWLLEQGVNNLVYDKFNRSDEHNEMALEFAKSSTTTTCFNVLNVIKEREHRKQVIKECKRENTKTIYFSVYNGDMSGEGTPTRGNSWQNNKPLKYYLDEVKEIYPSAEIVKGMITAKV